MSRVVNQESRAEPGGSIRNVCTDGFFSFKYLLSHKNVPILKILLKTKRKRGKKDGGTGGPQMSL
jgi:hypothetical protein